MNGSTSSPVSTPQPAELSSERIDASCHVLMVPILAGLVWLLVSSLFALVASVKLHSPAVLANCAWLSYGHARPAANDAFVYGFASQAGLAVALWILCRLGRSTLIGSIPIAIGTLFWNLGVGVGVLAILGGKTSGYDWMEFPSAASRILIAAYFVFGITALINLKARRQAELYPSQWYILAALFWFPWLYTTARLLLFWFPVRGVMQLIVSSWFANGLFALWLTSLALAVLFYFIPKLVNAPLYSRTLAVLGFWSLAAFGCWGGFYRGQPLPAWIVSTGMAATAILLVPMLATVLNLWITSGDGTMQKGSLLGYFKTSLVFFALAAVFAIFAAFVPQLRLTLFGEGTEQLFLYGFVGLALFGAIHYLAPRLTGVENDKWICASGGAVTLGIIIYAAAYIVGGMAQRRKLIDGSIDFAVIMNATKPFIRISTIGLLLIVIGNAAILWRVLSLVRVCCRNCCSSCCARGDSVKLKAAEAAR